MTLLRFGAANCQSLRDYQEISLVASPLRDEGPDLISKDGFASPVVPAAMLYGANASGKSTMIAALQRLHSMVKFSHVRGGPKSTIHEYQPFALDDESEQRPMHLDCDFVLKGARFHYGFEVTRDAVVAEWLYAFSGSRKSVWFERGESQNDISFGRSLKGRNKAISELTRKNSLFLSAAAQNSHDQLTEIYNYICSSWRFRIDPDSHGAYKTLQRGVIDPRVVTFLKFADTGVNEASIAEEEKPPFLKRFSEKFKNLVKETLEEEGIGNDDDLDISGMSRAVKLGHISSKGVVFLNLTHESRGTSQLIDLLTDIYETIDSGGALIVDELENSLHALLARELVGLFGSKETNPNGAQLIATTHDTNLMQHQLFRRDQIWLCEKGPDGSSSV